MLGEHFFYMLRVALGPDHRHQALKLKVVFRSTLLNGEKTAKLSSAENNGARSMLFDEDVF